MRLTLLALALATLSACSSGTTSPAADAAPDTLGGVREGPYCQRFYTVDRTACRAQTSLDQRDCPSTGVPGSVCSVTTVFPCGLAAVGGDASVVDRDSGAPADAALDCATLCRPYFEAPSGLPIHCEFRADADGGTAVYLQCGRPCGA